MTSALMTAGYWAALAIGRVVSGVYFSGRREASRLLLVSVAVGGVASLTLALSSGNIAIASIAAFVAGLSFGPIWPATLAIATEGGAAGSATAATVTMGNAGGLAIPWIQGRVLVSAGPSQGVAVTAVLCALMFAIVAGFRARGARP
jgi:DHA1 family inner membrane transport protein